MKDHDKTKQQLVDEVAELRQRIAALEDSEKECRKVKEELRKSEELFDSFTGWHLSPTSR